MAAQRCLAFRIGLRFEIVGNVLQYLDVGRDAFCLDRTSRRRVVTRRGQAQRAVAGAERDDGLHRAFAERPGADQRRALMSCNAPATISEADAEPPLIRTIS